MTDYSRGDVVLVYYRPLTATQAGLRPAVVVSSETYQQGRGQLLLALATSAEKRPSLGDTVIRDWNEAGLIRESLVAGVLLTVNPDAIDRKLGSLSEKDAQSLESSLRVNLGL